MLTQSFLFLKLSHQQWRRVGVQKKLRKDTPEMADPEWPILFNVVTRGHKGKKEEGEKLGGRGDLGSDGVCIPKLLLKWWTPAFWGMAEHLPDFGKWWTNVLFWFSYICGSFVPFRLSLSQPMCSCIFTFLILSAYPTPHEWGSQQGIRYCFAACWG